MITVACVLRSGGEYRPEHVEELRDGVRANLGRHRFLCLSDVEVPCERAPLRHDWPGWWAKIELFWWLRSPTLYLDLDTVIVGDLGEIAAQAERASFTILRDFYRQGDVVQSSLMAWHGDWSHLYTEFAGDPRGHMAANRKPHAWGDQGFIGRFVADAARWQDVLPGQAVSYKVHCREAGRAPEGGRVVCYHGKPRPWEVPALR